MVIADILLLGSMVVPGATPTTGPGPSSREFVRIPITL